MMTGCCPLAALCSSSEAEPQAEASKEASTASEDLQATKSCCPAELLATDAASKPVQGSVAPAATTLPPCCPAEAAAASASAAPAEVTLPPCCPSEATPTKASAAPAAPPSCCPVTETTSEEAPADQP